MRLVSFGLLGWDLSNLWRSMAQQGRSRRSGLLTCCRDDRLDLRRRLVSAFRPRPVVRQRGHHRDTSNADHDLHPDGARDLDQHDMCGKGQEYAGAKDFERLLAAFDCGPKDPPFQPRPIAWQQTDDKESEHDKMQQAIGREVGFVVRIEGAEISAGISDRSSSKRAAIVMIRANRR